MPNEYKLGFSAIGATVDRESKRINNVALMTQGPARGHGFNIDGETLTTFLAAAGKRQPMRWGHPTDILGGYADPLGKHIGHVENIRLDGNAVRGDVVFGKHADKVPGHGDVASYAMDMAETYPTDIGMSAVIRGDLTDKQNPPSLRVTESLAVDIVGVPAANPAGMLSAQGAGGHQMADPINGAGTTPQAQNGGAPVPVETPAQLAEKRKAGITEVYLSANGKLSHDWLKTAIEGTQTVEEVKLSALKELTSDKPAPGAVNVIVRQEPETTTELLSAAVSIAVKKTDGIGAETLDKANRMFSRGLGLGELMLCAARANGYQGRGIRDQREVMRFAFANSTVNIAGILSNVANKFLLGGYEMVDQTWRQISTIRSVSDFKTITSYRLTGANSVGTVNHGGELPLGNLTEESYTNSAATYGVRFAISRTDIVNDDLGAITSVPTKIGRDHAEKFNRVFWAAFMDNASFFASGNSNYISGATTVLSLDSLASGYATLEAMKDADSKVIGVKPAILLVPSALRMTARNLCESENIVTGKDATLGSRNGMAGLLRYASCAYLQDSTITGYSSVAWYLLAEPGAIGVVESVFLNGNETPTVETADADFATLGIQMRGYFDYGVAKQDKRGGLKSKGAA